MPGTRYKIWTVGEPLRDGATGARHVGVAGVAKCAGPNSPFIVANELICGNLARILLLPIPPGFLIEHEDKPHWVSLNFNLKGEELPPVNAAILATANAHIATGILMFDIWIANPDRHNRNVAYDVSSNKVQVFDHSHALLGCGTITDRLGKLDQDLGIANHCLLKVLKTPDRFRFWSDRIHEVPDYYINDVVESAKTVGLRIEDISSCTKFLIRRRDELLHLIDANRKKFVGIEQTLWDSTEPTGANP